VTSEWENGRKGEWKILEKMKILCELCDIFVNFVAN
jgi:hypothetical protein